MIYDYQNKDGNITQLNNYMLVKTLSMFEWENLPETIPVKELERLLQVSGYAFITKVNGELYAFNGGLGGESDPYGNPTKIIINNPSLKFNETLDIKKDGILIFNDDFGIGLMPLFSKYNSMLIENDINMVLNGFSSRMPMLISASDDKAKQSAEIYLKKIVKGELGVIGENPLFDGLRTHSNGSNQSNSITSLIEYHQYIKGGLYNEIGLSSAFNMKKERLITSEVEQGEDSLFPLVYNMMANRIEAVKRINEMYDLNIDVDFGSVWNFKNRKFVDNVLGDESNDNAPIDEPTDEPLNEPLEATDETTDEPLNEPLETPTESPTEIKEDFITDLQLIIDDENSSDDDIKTAKELLSELEVLKDD